MSLKVGVMACLPLQSLFGQSNTRSPSTCPPNVMFCSVLSSQLGGNSLREHSFLASSTSFTPARSGLSMITMNSPLRQHKHEQRQVNTPLLPNSDQCNGSARCGRTGRAMHPCQKHQSLTRPRPFTSTHSRLDHDSQVEVVEVVLNRLEHRQRVPACPSGNAHTTRRTGLDQCGAGAETLMQQMGWCAFKQDYQADAPSCAAADSRQSLRAPPSELQ